MKTLPLLPEAVEQQWGQKIAHELNRSNRTLPHDIGERLRVGRQNAVQLFRQQRRLAASVQHHWVGGHVAAMSGSALGWWGKVAAMLPVVVLALGLAGISEVHDQSRALESAKVDVALLTDDLPPSAYSDPGFIRFVTLQSQSPTPEAATQ